MAGEIQRVPRGIKDILGLKAQEIPQTLGAFVQPTLDMQALYLAESRLVAIQGNVVSGVGPNLGATSVCTVPNGENWLLLTACAEYQYSTAALTTTLAELTYLDNNGATPIPVSGYGVGNQPIGLRGLPLLTLGAQAGFWMPSGSALSLFVGSQGLVDNWVFFLGLMVYVPKRSS